MTDFIREGHFARHIRRMLMLNRDRRKELVRAIEAHMGDAIEGIGADAGMHLVALLQVGLNDVKVSQKAGELGMSAMPLSICYMGLCPRDGLILGYGNASRRMSVEGIQRLMMCLNEPVQRAIS